MLLRFLAVAWALVAALVASRLAHSRLARVPTTSRLARVVRPARRVPTTLAAMAAARHSVRFLPQSAAAVGARATMPVLAWGRLVDRRAERPAPRHQQPAIPLDKET